MIRSLNRDDLLLFNELHSRGEEASAYHDELGERVYRELYPRLYLDHPWASERFPSFVSEDRDGQLNGAIGVMNRPFRLGDEELMAAVSAELFVDPTSRSSLCGLQLLKQFLNGEQDFSIADVANETTRQIWTRLGGSVLPVYGMTWMAMLDPCRFATSLALRNSLPGRIARPVARLVDAIARRLVSVESDVDVSKLTGEPLQQSHVVEFSNELLGHHSLKPIYDEGGTNWIWNRLNFVSRNAGPSRQTLVRDAAGKPLGWHIYQWKPGHVARVSQVVARENSEPQVFAHLLKALKQSGAPGAIGRVQPDLLQTLIDCGCLLRRRSCHVLIHSKRQDILQAFESGTAFLSLLDGEGAVQLWNDPRAALEQMADSTPHPVKAEALPCEADL